MESATSTIRIRLRPAHGCSTPPDINNGNLLKSKELGNRASSFALKQRHEWLFATTRYERRVVMIARRR
ncbi:MAG: hypothetical protein U9Q81_03120, partial [Pseudomonadota bacterium]|nr:hypothetical protein [Pseudomonadota bacterium]